MMDNFWAAIDAQLTQLKSAKSADDVIRILGGKANASAGDAFFGGSGGDATVMESLFEAGWSLSWAEASYYYVMRAPDGSKITYIEGDVNIGDTHIDT